ncbi:MAG TPA: hypothetical protein VI874_03580 [Candidatus Norongarragalinales archaeon]|nr:hypothetical protein [Candidatus Norongarragalinales archaeon]
MIEVLRMSSESKYTTVSLPTVLFEKIKKRIEKTEFTSVSDYVTYVLRELISDEPEEQTVQDDEEKVKDRLRSLGYIE